MELALKILGVIGLLLGLIGGFQSVVEPKLISPSWRAKLSRLLTSRTSSVAQRVTMGEVMVSALAFFDVLFGRKHWTLRCFLVSAIFTVAASVVSFLGIYEVSREGFYEIARLMLADDNINFIYLAICVNILIDYVSLWETRWIISHMRRENTIKHAVFLLLVDALFTGLVFALGISLCKTILDIHFLLPLIHKYDAIEVRSLLGTYIQLSSADGIRSNLVTYFWSTLELCSLSMMNVLSDLYREYWAFSLFIDGRPAYLLPSSTMWATSYLPSLLIWLYIFLWFLATRVAVLHRVSVPGLSSVRIGRFIFRGNYDVKEFPTTILLTNVIVWGVVVVFLRQLWLLGTRALQ